MTETVQVRPAQEGDATALLEFYNGLSDRSKRTFRPLGEQTTLEVCDGILRANRAENAEKLDFVALHGVQIVGWGFVHDLKSAEPFFGLGVADDWQGKGLGARLMDAALGEARARGITRVVLTVVQDNTVAQAMYQRRGFVRYGECVGDDGISYYRMRADVDAAPDGVRS